jgi:hypothetical protein
MPNICLPNVSWSNVCRPNGILTKDVKPYLFNHLIREQISAIDRLWCLDRCRREGQGHFWCNTLYGPDHCSPSPNIGSKGLMGGARATVVAVGDGVGVAFVVGTTVVAADDLVIAFVPAVAVSVSVDDASFVFAVAIVICVTIAVADVHVAEDPTVDVSNDDLLLLLLLTLLLVLVLFMSFPKSLVFVLRLALLADVGIGNCSLCCYRSCSFYR